MSNVDFRINEYAILFGQFDEKITREFMIKKYPETAEYYKKLGQKDTPWDKILTKFIRENINFFGNVKVVNRKHNVFRDFMSHSPLADNSNFYEVLENLMTYGYDVSEEELEDARGIFPKLQDLMETEEFGQVMELTKGYKRKVENGWVEKSGTIKSHLTNILGFDFVSDNKKVIAFIMPPISENQRNYKISSDKIYFFWSQPEHIRENAREYSLTSIAHENLHHELPHKPTMTLDKKNEFHAFMKFVANKELYSKLTGKSYLENDSKNEDGNVMARVYPYWLGYLHRKDENPINGIRKDIERDRLAFKKLEPNSRKRKLYGNYNFEKLSPEKIAEFFIDKKGITPYEFNDIDFSQVGNMYADRYLRLETRD